MPNPLVVLRLSNARTLSEVASIWVEENAELSGGMFVLSVPEPSEARWAARVNFPAGGYLRSVFAHDKLLFASDEILERMAHDDTVTLALDYTIGFDSNAAQYLRTLVEGSGNDRPDIINFRTTLRTLTGTRMNWELMPFLIEHAQAIRTGRDADYIWRLVYASEYFHRCDNRHFADTGELRLRATAEEVTNATQHALVDWLRVLSVDGLAGYHGQHLMIQVLLIKAALLRHAQPAAASTARNLEEFLEFMCEEVGCNLPWMLWAAAGLFGIGGRFEPLRKLTCPPGRCVEQARNIAWDIVHYMIRRDLAKPIGRGGSFMVPYTLTFDRGLAEFFDGQPQRSCLLHPEREFPQFFADRNIEGDVLSRFPELSNVAGRHLTMNAHAARVARIRAEGPRDLRPLLQQLAEACSLA